MSTMNTSRKGHTRRLTLFISALLIVLIAWLASRALNDSGDPALTMPERISAELVTRGAYLARAGDCVACHTAPGGQPFAGGLGIKSPIGTIYATNITPDPETGIGRWTYGDFERAVRRGIGRDGSALYPAMPYPSYARLSDEDTQALYAWLMREVVPVHQDNQRNGIVWPLSIRWPLAYWRALFAPSPTTTIVLSGQDSTQLDPRIARGAYLVQGLGHCGSCHTPRALTMQEKGLDDSAPAYLTGTSLNGWAVPSIRGLARWSQRQIVDYLGSGRNDIASVAGEMTGVVTNSTSHLSDDDLSAIAAYLKSLGSVVESPVRASGDTTTAMLTRATHLTPGQRLYLDNCGACHFVSGQGAPGIFPRLDGATVVNANDPGGLLQVILGGASTPSTSRAPSIVPMPGFAYRLDDDQAATLATFVRQAWSNHGASVTAEQARDARKNLHERANASRAAANPP